MAITKTRQRLVAIGFGTFFLLLLLIVAFVVPSPTPFQQLVFRILLAMAAAGAAAAIPGSLEVEVGTWVKAGGAIGVFIVIYFFKPAQLVVSPPSPSSEPSATESANRFALHVSDSKRIPLEGVEIGAISGSLSSTDAEGKVVLALQQPTRIWERIELQLGARTSENWRIVSPWDRYVRVPPADDFERVILLARGCVQCLSDTNVARNGALRILEARWHALMSNEAGDLIDFNEARVKKLAEDWGVTESNVVSMFDILEQSNEAFDAALVASYRGDGAAAKSYLPIAGVKLGEEVLLLENDTQARWTALDNLITVDLLRRSAESGFELGSPVERQTVRGDYEGAFSRFLVGNSSSEAVELLSGEKVAEKPEEPFRPAGRRWR